VAKLPDVKVLEEEKVPETLEVQKTMESMINLDGAKILFPTSFGYYDPHILKVAPKYPEVTFLHAGGLYQVATRRTPGAISVISTRPSMWPGSSRVPLAKPASSASSRPSRSRRS
jgi:hypothetical protein